MYLSICQMFSLCLINLSKRFRLINTFQFALRTKCASTPRCLNIASIIPDAVYIMKNTKKSSLLGYKLSATLTFLSTARNEPIFDDIFCFEGVHNATYSLNFNFVKLSAYIGHVNFGSKKCIKCLWAITQKEKICKRAYNYSFLNIAIFIQKFRLSGRRVFEIIEISSQIHVFWWSFLQILEYIKYKLNNYEIFLFHFEIFIYIFIFCIFAFIELPAAAVSENRKWNYHCLIVCRLLIVNCF